MVMRGQKNGYAWMSPIARFINWTDGCVALSDGNMDIVWERAAPGTPIEIRPWT